MYIIVGMTLVALKFVIEISVNFQSGCKESVLKKQAVVTMPDSGSAKFLFHIELFVIQRLVLRI